MSVEDDNTESPEWAQDDLELRRLLVELYVVASEDAAIWEKRARSLGWRETDE